MSSNNSFEPQASAAQGGDDVSELVVAIVALVISISAFTIATLQALQQYFSSATGYSSCSEKVMGKWSRFTHRKMRWHEFRFEVRFSVPVIFVAPPTNKKGPLGEYDGTEEKKKYKIEYMDGSDDSYQNTYTLSQTEFDRDGGRRQNIRTANNELATWLDLLMAIQRMEKESRQWQDKWHCDRELPRLGHKLPVKVETPHTLCVGIQKKKQSWDSMPSNLKKPYAITTIGHLVEVAAMLGIYWKEFNRNDDRYRAQGNGFSMLGMYVDDLGVVFTFRKTGPTWFQNHRVVPNDMVKELCFGLSPTIFRKSDDKIHKYADESKDKGTLQLGSLDEIAETLVVFGCNTNTVDYFSKNAVTSRHDHLFPIPFEILGMVGVVLHIENTPFRMLPNPTVFHWKKKSFSLPKLLSNYYSAIKELQRDDKRLRDSSQARAIETAAGRVEEELLKEDELGTNPEPTRQQMEQRPYLYDTIMALRTAINKCDGYLQTDDKLHTVEHVLRAHLQEVLSILNDHSGEDEIAGDDDIRNSVAANATLPKSTKGKQADTTSPTKDDDRTKDNPPTLADIDAATPEERHRLLIKLYFWTVRKRVVQIVCDQVSIASITTPDMLTNSSREENEGKVNDIWLTLVFRMLCWLLLHDFHKKDIQISRSEVYDSRLPVYIS